MSSSNGSGRPTGSISIPVEIVRDSNSTGSRSHSRQNSPFRTNYNDNLYSGYSDSPPWGSNSSSRFQPRHSPNTAYDRVINNSQFNQPVYDQPSFQQYPDPQYRPTQSRIYEGNPSSLRRSNEDLLNSPFNSLHADMQTPFTSLIHPSFNTGFPSESDFVQSMGFPSSQRRSFDALNEFPDVHQNFPSSRQYQSEQPQPQQQQQPYYRTTYQTQHQPQMQQQQQQQPNYGNQSFNNPNIVYTNEYGQPTEHYHQNTFQGSSNNPTNDRSRSPTSQRGASPVRPPPTSQQQQQQQQQQEEEPELKMASDADGPIPMPAPTSSPSTSTSPTTTQATDSQVPPPDVNASTTNTQPPPPEPVRDPNTIALEKLAQMKEMLDTLERDVDSFNGSTRNGIAYKALDEQALKIMIRCDELVDVSADIKEKRKEMIRHVQKVINKLESKVPSTPAVEKNSNPMETVVNSSNVTDNRENVQEQASSVSKPQNDTISTATKQSIST